jgi:hypothetical protein
MKDIKDKKELARYLYFSRRLDNTTIITTTGVTKTSLYRWIKEENWDKLRQANTVSPMDTANKLREHIVWIEQNARELNRPLNGKEIDGIIKLQNIIERVSKKSAYIDHAFTVMTEFVIHLKSAKPDLFDQLSNTISIFMENLTRNFQKDINADE